MKVKEKEGEKQEVNKKQVKGKRKRELLLLRKLLL